MKRFLVACAVALAGLAAVPAAFAYPSELTRDPFAYDGMRYCPSGPIVVDVTQDVVNDVDIGTAGNVWAGTYYTRRLIVTRIDSRTFCAVAMYGGKFETRAGLSPSATGIVGPGIGGRLAGNYRTTVFKAMWRPTAATSGWIGTFDYACDAFASCPGYVDWKSLYFTDVSNFAIARYSFQYQTFANGTWTNRAPEANSGDITGV